MFEVHLDAFIMLTTLVGGYKTRPYDSTLQEEAGLTFKHLDLNCPLDSDVWIYADFPRILDFDIEFRVQSLGFGI